MEGVYIEQLVEVNDDDSMGGNTQFFDPAYFNQYVTTEDGQSLMAPPPIDVYYARNNNNRKTKLGILPERAYMCELCKTPFTNSSNLKAHLRTHTGEKPYSCEICGLAFVQSSNMKAHARTHTGERPFVCSICGQTFSRSSHLTGHMRTHTGEKPYICGTCGESFATSTHLRNHVKKHSSVTPYTCNICEQSFQHNSQLMLHMKVHNGDRPYKCSDCAGAFRSKGDLRSHRKLHAGDKPFLCGKCAKTFKTYQYLAKHLSKCPARVSSGAEGEDNHEEESGNGLLATEDNTVAQEPEPNIYLSANMMSQIKGDSNAYGSTFELIDENGQSFSFMGGMPAVDGQFQLQTLKTMQDGAEPAIQLVTMPTDDQRVEQQLQLRALACSQPQTSGLGNIQIKFPQL